MRLWIDEQLSPALAAWILVRFGVDAISARDLRLARARDSEIFFAARRSDAIVMTTDQDFVRLLRQHGPPPRVLWVTLGNTSNDRLRMVLETTLRGALALLEAGDSLVEIRDATLVRTVEP